MNVCVGDSIQPRAASVGISYRTRDRLVSCVTPPPPPPQYIRVLRVERLTSPPPSIPPDSAGLFSEGGGVIKPYIEGSLTIPKPGLKGYNDGDTKDSSLKHSGLKHRVM